MRSLIISAVSLFMILGIWFGFMTYCENTLNDLIAEITDEIEVSVHEEDWDGAQKSFQNFSKDWHREKTYYSLFLEQSAMLEADFAISRAEAYIGAEDYANTMGELAYIREQLRFLFLNERINLENIL